MTEVAWRRIAAILVLPALVGLAAALWSAWLGHSTTGTDLTSRLAAPSAAHPLGTDEFGRDVLARLVQAAGLSLGLSSAALAGSALLGTALGMAAAWRGGAFGAAAIGGTDAFVALPTVVIALVLVAITGPGITTVLLAVLAVNWTPFARLAYRLTAKVASAGHVEAAVARPSSRFLPLLYCPDRPEQHRRRRVLGGAKSDPKHCGPSGHQRRSWSRCQGKTAVPRRSCGRSPP